MCLHLDGIQLPYIFSTVFLSLTARAQHVRLQSKHVQAHLRLLHATSRLAFCLWYPEREGSISVTSLCFCVLLVEHGGALESCV